MLTALRAPSGRPIFTAARSGSGAGGSAGAATPPSSPVRLAALPRRDLPSLASTLRTQVACRALLPPSSSPSLFSLSFFGKKYSCGVWHPQLLGPRGLGFAE